MDNKSLHKNKRDVDNLVIEEIPSKKKQKSENISTNGNKLIPELDINHMYTNGFELMKKQFNNELIDEKQSDSFLQNNYRDIRQPFQVTQLKQFIQDESMLRLLMKSISNLNLNRLNNDLYSLKQSKDLSKYSEFKPVCQFFQDKVRPFLQNLTGTTLNSNVALTISRYDQNDYLLCHDDQLDGRKIAFILYLVDKEWSSEDGGQLELFRCKSDDHQPLEVVERLTPEWNMFCFFIVQPYTYHQVSEVKTSRFARLSINGWFHSSDVTIIPRNYSFRYNHIRSWINPCYFVDNNIEDIQRYFVDKSEIQLVDFLRTEKYRELSEALRKIDEIGLWKKNYCPVLSRYEYIPRESLLDTVQTSSSKMPMNETTKIVQEALDIFTSEPFFLLLSNLTGVPLHPRMKILDNESEQDETKKDENNSKLGKCRAEIRKWQFGDYSLASDIAPEYSELSALDFQLYLNVKKLNETNEVQTETISKIEAADQSDEEDDEEVTFSDEDSNEEESEEDEDENDEENDEEEEEEDKDSNDSTWRGGGYICYCEKDSSQDLLSIEPCDNSLNLVYRLKGTHRFMKYINSANVHVPFNELSLVYYQPDDETS
ncbi:hypothetical protein RDWZM_007392 [Blomia tropicalis]|uniref:uS12 prolyl 3-hydroxylase n=1 Tax=Blomia tropicalis TaxID=40697 RepID=A0A9Q0RJD7_BLOTA|nr:hypothetical protein RDWZM_007392 [Blomia tropicalis]